MAYFSSNRLTVGTEPTLKRSDKGPYTTLFLIENINKKGNNGKWETVRTNTYQAVVFGDKAIEAAMLPVGTSIRVMPERVEKEDGQNYLRFGATISENTFTNKKGETVTTIRVILNNWEVIEKNG